MKLNPISISNDTTRKHQCYPEPEIPLFPSVLPRKAESRRREQKATGPSNCQIVKLSRSWCLGGGSHPRKSEQVRICLQTRHKDQHIRDAFYANSSDYYNRARREITATTPVCRSLSTHFKQWNISSNIVQTSVKQEVERSNAAAALRYSPIS